MPASIQPIYAGAGFRGGIGFFETCYLLVVYDGLLFARKAVAHLCSFLSVVFSVINIRYFRFASLVQDRILKAQFL